MWVEAHTFVEASMCPFNEAERCYNGGKLEPSRRRNKSRRYQHKTGELAIKGDNLDTDSAVHVPPK